MFTPRALTTLRLWVLGWVLVSMGAAMASPLVSPQGIELICASNGSIQMRVLTDDGAVEVGSTGMDCPLCSPLGTAPPPAPAPAPLPPHPLAHALQRIEAAHIAALTAAPLPARGPPHH